MLYLLIAAVTPTQFVPELVQMIPDGPTASMVAEPARAAIKKVQVVSAGQDGTPEGTTAPSGSRRASSLDFGVDQGTTAPFGLCALLVNSTSRVSPTSIVTIPVVESLTTTTLAD